MKQIIYLIKIFLLQRNKKKVVEEVKEEEINFFLSYLK